MVKKEKVILMTRLAIEEKTDPRYRFITGSFWFDDYDIDTLVAQLRIKGRKASPDDTSLENARIELKLYPGTQTGVYTGLADTPEWKSRILQDLENISINVTIDENGVVHERKKIYSSK